MKVFRLGPMLCGILMFGNDLKAQTVSGPPRPVNTLRDVGPTQAEMRAAVITEMVSFRLRALDNFVKIEACNAHAVGADTLKIRKIVEERKDYQFLIPSSNGCLGGAAGVNFAVIDSINMGPTQASVYMRVRRGHLQFADVTVLARGSEPLMFFVVRFTLDKVLMVH